MTRKKIVWAMIGLGLAILLLLVVGGPTIWKITDTAISPPPAATQPPPVATQPPPPPQPPPKATEEQWRFCMEWYQQKNLGDCENPDMYWEWFLHKKDCGSPLERTQKKVFSKKKAEEYDLHSFVDNMDKGECVYIKFEEGRPEVVSSVRKC